MTSAIPTLDIRDYTQATTAGARAEFVQRLGDAYREWGFAGIRGHAIAQALIEDAYRAFQAFFALPDHIKRQYHVPGIGGSRGYTPFGIETAKGAQHHDLKEFYHVGRELPPDSPYRAVMPPNVWPDAHVPGFRPAALALYRALDGLGNTVLEVLAQDLGLAPDYFKSRTSQGNSILRPLHYPPITATDIPNVRAGAHEDINLITLLIGASAEGLEVRSRKGEWVAYTAHADTIVVNIGDMLQRLTNHVYPSTTHRVVNPRGEAARRARYSVPFFLHPNPDVSLAVLPQCVDAGHPARYSDDITANQYLDERLREIGLKM